MRPWLRIAAPSTDRGWLAAILAVAAVARVGWVLAAGPAALDASDDAKAYHDLAVNLVERHQFVTTIDPPHRLDEPYAQRPPLTPLVLALPYAILGPNVRWGQLVMAVLGVLTVAALFALTRRVFSRPVAIIAALLAAGSPFLVFLAAVPLTENLAALLYLLIAIALLNLASAASTGWALAAGALLGAAALNRPQILVLAPLIPCWAWVSLRTLAGRRRMALAGLILGSWMLVITPWTLRNLQLFGRLIPVSLQGGIALYEGNNPFTGTALDKLENGARGWYDDPRWGKELSGLPPAEADRRALRLAVSYAGEHPGEVAGYAWRKLRIFWSAYDHPVHALSWYPVLVLSVIGLAWTRRQWRELLPVHLLMVTTMLTAMAFTSMPRFRALVEPFLLMFASFALVRLFEMVEARRTVRGPDAWTSDAARDSSDGS